jgi:hypothetical protein
MNVCPRKTQISAGCWLEMNLAGATMDSKLVWPYEHSRINSRAVGV